MHIDKAHKKGVFTHMPQRFNMYMRAVFYVADLAIWKRRMRRLALATMFYIGLFIATFFVPMNEEYRGTLLFITGAIALGFLALTLITWWLKPTEKRYHIDH